MSAPPFKFPPVLGRPPQPAQAPLNQQPTPDPVATGVIAELEDYILHGYPMASNYAWRENLIKRLRAALGGDR